jgi:hypothetical protein
MDVMPCLATRRYRPLSNETTPYRVNIDTGVRHEGARPGTLLARPNYDWVPILGRFGREPALPTEGL